MEYHEVTKQYRDHLRYAYYQNILNGDGSVSSEADSLFQYLLNDDLVGSEFYAWIAMHDNTVVSACMLRSIFVAPTKSNNSGMVSFIAPLFTDSFDAELLALAVSRAKELGISKLHIISDEDQCEMMVESGVELSDGLKVLSIDKLSL